MPVYTIRADTIPEYPVRGMPLGRHILHDSRSRSYAVPELPFGAIHSVAWTRHVPVFDQGDVGSCTGNAITGAIATDPLYPALPPATELDEKEALRLYSAAETIDGDGPYPPQDNGSSGLSVAKAARNAGLISGYTHAFSRAAMLTALQAGPVICGMNWYTSMDNPDASGRVLVNGTVRGGHEVACREVDVAAGLVWFDNSWGESWGRAGRFCMSFTSLDRLLGEGGDVTVPLPATSPPPVPVPVIHPDRVLGHDPRMIAWAASLHEGDNAYAARAYTAWRTARGYT